MSSTKRRGERTARAPHSRNLERRALAIVNDAKGYDEDTRQTIRAALNTKADDLAELVRRAEAGETVIDLADSQRIAEQQARAFIDFSEKASIPEFIKDEALDALTRAAYSLGLADVAWTPNDTEADVCALARFFASVPRLFLLREHPAAQIIGEALATILNNEETPEAIHNARVDVVSDMESVYANAYGRTPAYLSKVLATYAEQKKGGEE
jgi:hypothetical protein